MRTNIYIVESLSKEVQLTDEREKQAKAKRFEKWKEFRESTCDLFTFWDFEYYAEECGLPMDTLKRYARYSETVELSRDARNEARNISRLLGTAWAG